MWSTGIFAKLRAAQRAAGTDWVVLGAVFAGLTVVALASLQAGPGAAAYDLAAFLAN